MDSRRGPIRGSKTHQKAYSQQDHPDHLMSRSISNHSELDYPHKYDSRAASFIGYPNLVNGSSRAASIGGPLISMNGNVPLPDVGVDPFSYLSACGGQSFHHANGPFLTVDEVPNSIMTSVPPSMVSGISAMELHQPLTRQNSSCSYIDDGNAMMMRLLSSQSHGTDGLSTHNPLQSTGVVDQCAMGTVSETDLLQMGARFDTTGQTYPLLNGNDVLQLPFPSMERSLSETSTSSAKSTGSSSERRRKDAWTRTIQNGKSNAIRPKEDGTMAVRTSPTMRPGRGCKVTPPKAPYVRPKGLKVFCELCKDHADGFRGEHELRRHRSAKHQDTVKKFVCRDPATVGIVSSVQALQPLADCKACSSGKQYGAYYNAAAHLRRTHFKPKAPRGKNKRPNDEKRGGKGGGNWPSMSELKNWFQEVYVSRDDDVHSVSLASVDEEDPALDDNSNSNDWTLDQAIDDDASDCDAEGDFCMWVPMAAQYQEDDAVMCSLRRASSDDTQLGDPSRYEPAQAIDLVMDAFSISRNDAGPCDFFSQEEQSYQWPGMM
ncbi:hypothetical protein ED733_007672 [Metarhizium rileyi]|uniref:DUF7896 domain-containing protein n=1 Tax=Metarhizium rileyi (strain RCEF 4871) TaxID=1649241 RepID=A0A5C6GD93_METRR|nr:hypothetical protein ED733_007672 [Metarhizium rileyi]